MYFVIAAISIVLGAIKNTTHFTFIKILGRSFKGLEGRYYVHISGVIALLVYFHNTTPKPFLMNFYGIATETVDTLHIDV